MIGQERSTMAQLNKIFSKAGALEYCIIIATTILHLAPLQILTSYSSCAMGGYF